MSKLKNEYRIVVDSYCGYEVQTKKWWFPFGWWQCGVNTHSSIEEAQDFALKHSTIIYLGKLPLREVI